VSVITLGSQIDKFQSQLSATQASWNDPARVEAFAETLKKYGGANVIVVPYGPAAPLPPK
jgi:hypothetical protein